MTESHSNTSFPQPPFKPTSLAAAKCLSLNGSSDASLCRRLAEVIEKVPSPSSATTVDGGQVAR